MARWGPGGVCHEYARISDQFFGSCCQNATMQICASPGMNSSGAPRNSAISSMSDGVTITSFMGSEATPQPGRDRRLGPTGASAASAAGTMAVEVAMILYFAPLSSDRALPFPSPGRNDTLRNSDLQIDSIGPIDEIDRADLGRDVTATGERVRVHKRGSEVRKTFSRTSGRDGEAGSEEDRDGPKELRGGAVVDHVDQLEPCLIPRAHSFLLRLLLFEN